MEQLVTTEESSPQTDKIAVEEQETKDSENGNVEEEMERVVPSKTEAMLSEKEEPTLKDFFLSSNGAMCPEFLEDQHREKNFTDLDLICYDGFIQVHRCILMGASKFIRDLLIEKDIMDCPAISLPDISIHHLRRALGLIYSGRTIIDGNDEVEIYDTMNLLGLPTADLECRAATLNDMDQVVVVKHIPDDSTCLKDDCERKIEVEGMEGVHEMESDKTVDDVELEEKDNKEIKSDLEEGGNRAESEPLTEPVDHKSDFEEGPVVSPTGEDESEDDDDHLQQITSTTGDPLVINDLTAATPPCSQNVKDKGSKSEKCMDDLKEVGQHEKTIIDTALDKDALSKDKNHWTNNVTDRNGIGDAESDNPNIDLDSSDNGQSNNTSLQSTNSDNKDDDLNFEEACNDLQKQVAKPSSLNNGIGFEMIELRKRKSDDSDTTEVKEPTEETPTGDVRSTRSKTKAKKKKATPKRETRRMNLRSSGGTNTTNKDENVEEPKTNANQIDEESAKISPPLEKRPREKSPDRESLSSVKSRKSDTSSQQQRRLSTCSNTTEGSSTTSSGRVLMGIREINGIKYNIYGLMDPINGCQSGKTIAIMASMDKTKNSG